METCKNSGYDISDHFGEVTEMVQIGSGAKRDFPGYQLSSLAGIDEPRDYAIFQNKEYQG